MIKLSQYYCEPPCFSFQQLFMINKPGVLLQGTVQQLVFHPLPLWCSVCPEMQEVRGQRLSRASFPSFSFVQFDKVNVTEKRQTDLGTFKPTMIDLKRRNWRGMLDEELLTSKQNVQSTVCFSVKDATISLSQNFSFSQEELKLCFWFQVSAGAGFPGDADRSGADHRRLHCSDARRERGDRPRQRPGGGPQKALQETQRLREFFPQQVE